MMYAALETARIYKRARKSIGFGRFACPGGPEGGGHMKFIRITDQDTPDQIAEAIRHLRARQERTELASVRAEISADINELVDLHCERTRVAR